MSVCVHACECEHKIVVLCALCICLLMHNIGPIHAVCVCVLCKTRPYDDGGLIFLFVDIASVCWFA